MKRTLVVGLVLAGSIVVLACSGGPGDLGNGGVAGGNGNDNTGNGNGTNSVSTTPTPTSTTIDQTGGGGDTATPKGNTKVTLSDYDQSCKAASDCAVVVGGDLCGPCSCPNGAINVKDRSTYQSDAAQAVANCPPSTGDVPACAPCPPLQATCNGGGKCGTGK